MTDLAIVWLLVIAMWPIMWAAWLCCDAMNMGEADGMALSRFHQSRVYSILMPFYEYGRKTGIQFQDKNKIGTPSE